MSLVDLLITRLESSDKAVNDLGVETNYKRYVWRDLTDSLQSFLDDGFGNKWLVMTGLRGVGKTTLLAQLYRHHRLETNQVRKIYFSLEELQRFPDASMADFIHAIDRFKRIYHDQPLVLLLDEVHSMPDWQKLCKLLFDTSRQILLICTGSSALNLNNLSADVARRISIIRVPPVSLGESFGVQDPNQNAGVHQQLIHLRRRLRRALFQSDHATGVYQRLKDNRHHIDNYYQQLAVINGLGRMDQIHFRQGIIESYIHHYRTLPFALADLKTPDSQVQLIPSDSSPLFGLSPAQDYQLRDKIVRTITQAVIADITKLLGPDDRFLVDKNSKIPIEMLPKLLARLANSNTTALTTISRTMSVAYPTLIKMIELLKGAEIIVEITPKVKDKTKTTKTAKYLFATPALRQALIYQNPEKLKGVLLEDTVAMYLRTIFSHIPYPVIEYDSSKGGADFVFRPNLGDRNIVVEVGYNKQNSRQITKTLHKKDLYGLMITTNTDLRLDDKNQTVFVPLEYFLLS